MGRIVSTQPPWSTATSHDDGAGIHLPQHLARNQNRRAASRHQNGADDQVGLAQGFAYGKARGYQRLDPAVEDIVDIFEARVIDVENHVTPACMPTAILAAFFPYNARSEDDHVSPWNARRPGQQDAAAP